MHTTTMTEIVEAAAAGDAGAWRNLVDRHQGLLRSVARRFRMSAEDADDAAQATWAISITQLSSVRDPERIAGWLATTMRRECIRIVGRRRREVHLPDEVLERASPHGPVDEALLRREQAQLVRAALTRLPPGSARC